LGDSLSAKNPDKLKFRGSIEQSLEIIMARSGATQQ